MFNLVLQLPFSIEGLGFGEHETMINMYYYYNNL